MKYSSFKYGSGKYIGTFSKQMISGVSVTGNVPRNITKTISAICGATIIIVRNTAKTVVANASVNSGIKRQVLKNVTAIVNTASALGSRTIAKTVRATVSAGITIARGITKTLQALVSATGITFRFWPVYPVLKHTDYVIDMEVIGLSIAGSTITLTATFPNSAGDLTQLTDVTLKIYAPGRMLLETITPTEISVGTYTWDYTIPADTLGQFEYEFSGKLGNRTIKRSSLFDSHRR
jgi:hypothetical protein